MKLSLTFVTCSVALMLAHWQTNQEQEVRRIPLDSAYTSGEQEGTKNIFKSLKNSIVPVLGDTVEGSPTIFLVNGRDIDTAVATSGQYFKFRGDSKPPKVSAEVRNSEPAWVVAYMGQNGSGPVYLVKSIEVQKQKVRVSYEFLGGSVLLDFRHYLVWVPLEQLPPDEYQLELYYVGEKKVVATAKCKVTKN